MAEEEHPGGDRTEAATPRRLERAREAGQLAISRELGTFGSLAAAVMVLTYYAPSMFEIWVRRLASLIQQAGAEDVLAKDLWWSILLGLGNAAWLPAAAATLGGSIAILVQTRGLLHLGGLSPKISRVSPSDGLRRIFGTNGLVELLKSLTKLAAFGSALFVVTRSDLRTLARWPLQDMHTLPQDLGRALTHVLYATLLVQGVIAGGDLLWVLYHHAKSLRMTKQDIRDEFKEQEGNPHVKARIRRIGYARARRRMMTKVPTATVIVTNPTHYAVALAYDRASNAAPRVVAKGTDRVATKIREVAETAGVPIVSNPPLARALHRLELDTEIPAEHFRAVAEIIAYVWRLKRERPRLS
ncbi:MAG TPA: flagellar type III secretion system protein FlhB [Rhodopila sp.]|nr:flagellar type III secretion system protein FlhB [Rhodopila sp.]